MIKPLSRSTRFTQSAGGIPILSKSLGSRNENKLKLENLAESRMMEALGWVDIWYCTSTLREPWYSVGLILSGGCGAAVVDMTVQTGRFGLGGVARA